MIRLHSRLLFAGTIILFVMMIPAVMASGAGGGTGGFQTFGYDQGRSVYSTLGSYYENDPTPTPTPTPTKSLDIPGPLPTFPPADNMTSNLTDVNATQAVNATNTTEERDSGTETEEYASLAKYSSLGDIIRAGDWDALEEYKQKEHEENAALLEEDLDEFYSSNVGKWERRFNPQEIVVYCGSCG